MYQGNQTTQLYIMTDSQVIKNAGLKTKRINTGNYKGVFGGTCNHVIALLDSEDKVLCYEGKPYFPCGRKNAYADLIKSNSIKSECFSFKKFKLL